MGWWQNREGGENGPKQSESPYSLSLSLPHRRTDVVDSLTYSSRRLPRPLDLPGSLKSLTSYSTEDSQ